MMSPKGRSNPNSAQVKSDPMADQSESASILQLGTGLDHEFIDRWYAPQTPWPKIRPAFLKLPHSYSFDLERAQAEFRKVAETYPLKPFEILSAEGRRRPRRSYRGLGLTARAEAADPLYDALDLYGPGGQPLSIYHTFAGYSEKRPGAEREIATLDESGFALETSASTPFFHEILSRFKSPLTKVRFLELLPRGLIPPHVDFPYYQGIRVHATLESNPDVYWEVDGEQFQIPCDGNFYWFDTGRYHAVKNAGPSTRVVLSVNLSVYFNRDGSVRHSHHESLEDLIARGEV
jgi:hypothetical protein